MIYRTYLNLFKSEGLLLIVLLLGLSRFFGVNGTYLFIILYPLLFSKSGFRVVFSRMQINIILFSGTYVIFMIYNNMFKGGADVFYFLLYPFIFFNVGSYFGSKYNEKFILFLLIIIMIVQSIKWIIPIIANLIGFGSFNFVRSVYFDNIDINFTLIGVSFALLSAGVGLFSIPPSFFYQSALKRIILISAIVASLGSIFLVNRSIIVILAVSIIVSVTILIQERKFSLLIKSLTILIVATIIVLQTPQGKSIIASYEIREQNESYNMTYSTAGGRFERWLDGINTIIRNPFGGGKSQLSIYSHNMWIDATKTAGIIPGFFLLIFTLFSLSTMIRVLRSKSFSFFFKAYLFLLYLAFILTCSIEPILEGAFYHFLLFVLFSGVISSLSIKSTSLLKT